LRAQFLRLKSRRGPKKAVIAVTASMLTAAYHMPSRASILEASASITLIGVTTPNS